MGTFDKLKQKAQQFTRDNSEKVKEGIDKAAEAAKKHTGGKHDEQIDKGAAQARQRMGAEEPSPGDRPTDEPPTER